MFFSKKKKTTNTPVNGHSHAAASVEPSFIGRNAYFEGHINCDGELHIDGQVRGQVRAALCVIDRHGTVYGSVFGDVVHVRGRVTGPIQGGAVHVYSGAHIEGDVFNDTISVEPGAFVEGAIRRNQARAQSAPAQSPLDAINLKPASKSLRVVASDK